MAVVDCKECGNKVSTQADKCPSCGAPAKKKKGGILKVLAIGVVGFLALGMCSAMVAGTSKSEATTDVASAQATPKNGGSEATSPKAKSALGDHLVFGKPTLKPLMGSMSQVLVEVRNKGSMGTTCTVTATFKKGDDILGAANGAVNDVPAGGTKTAQLMSTDNVEGFDTVKLETSACFPSNAKATASGADARSGDPLKFGKPTVKNMAGMMSQVMVEATNSTGKGISCTVTATFKNGDEIVDTATGALNDVPPGGTKTAQLITTEVLGEYENVVLEASTCF